MVQGFFCRGLNHQPRLIKTKLSNPVDFQVVFITLSKGKSLNKNKTVGSGNIITEASQCYF